MIVTTTNELDGYRVVRHLGVVRGLTVRSRSVVGNIGAAIQIIFGGNISVYTNLAEQTRQQVDRRRLVEAERAPTRREVQALTLIMGGLVLGLLLLGRSEYLTAYDQPTGQVFLGSALAGYAALILRVQRLAAFPRPGRFLTAAVDESVDVGVIAR